MHKTNSLHISNREMKLEEEQLLLINQYKLELFLEQPLIASLTLQQAAQVNAEYDKEKQLNTVLAAALLSEHHKNLFIQNQLS